MGHDHNGFTQGIVLGAGLQVAHKRLVNLYVINVVLLQVRQRRKPGAEVIQRHLNPCLTEIMQLGGHCGAVVQ